MAEIKSPLADVKQILIQIRESARVYSEALRNNEAATRAVLIDPLLRVLGWDTGNPFMVEVERRLNQSRFDYALLDVNRETQIIVEAKSVGTDLAHKDTYMALVKYAFDAELENVFLTDGIQWHHFVEFKPGNTEPKTKLSIEATDLNDTATYFIQHLDASKYWEDESIDKISQEVRQLRGELNTLKADFVRQATEGLRGVSEPAAPISIQNQVTASNEFTPLSRLGNLKYTKPQLFRLPDNSVIKVGSWTDVLVQSCDFVLSKTNNIQIPLPDKAGKKTQLISLVQPPLGISYYERNYQGKQIFIYTNYDSNSCVRNAMYILGQLSIPQIADPAVLLS